MRHRALTFLCILSLSWLSPTAAIAADFTDAFARLKTLVGTWDVEGAGNGRYVEYSLSGGGETLVEEFKGEPTMATFYHMDGKKLMLTHYCNAGNQPRMTAAGYDQTRGLLSFRFLDVTNLKAPTAYHTHDLEIRFLTEDRVELTFIGRKDGKSSQSVLRLTRRAGGT